LPKNDEGEFELVLGNRQLISVFLIVVVLLGMFFSMGYVVGRNSSPATVDTARNERNRPGQPPDATSGSAADAPADESAAPSAATSSPSDSSAAPADSTPPEITRTAPSPAPAEARSRPKPSPAPPPSGPPVHAAAAGEPPGGQYWQVVATARPDAEIIAEALGKKGFHVVLAPAPSKDGVFRVLVGPLPDASNQAATRTGLESAGFKNPIMRKY
jgi:cell division septation protein DedD